MKELDKLAEHIADEVICEHCIRIATERAAQAVANSVAQKTEERPVEQDRPAEPVPWHIARYGTLDSPERKAHFEKLYSRLAKYEQRFADMLRKHWKEELAIILSNLKKLGKAIAGIRQKQGDFDDIIDSVLYPKRQMVAQLSEEAKKILIYILAKEGQHFLDELDIDVSFDVLNPNVTKWLKGYVPKFAKEIEAASMEKLRAELLAGMEAGEGVDKIARRLRGIFDDWDRQRARMVSRSETSRASNAAARMSYQQSKVVEKISWLSLPTACDFCANLDGKTISIKENFFNIGDELTVGEGENQQTMQVTYSDVGHPPLHPNCMCSIVAEVE